MSPFADARHRQSLIAVLITYMLDVVGYSLVFPVLSTLLLNPKLTFFPPEASTLLRTSVLGIVFALFGIAQVFAAPLLGLIADHVGRRRVFLWTIGNSVVGYAVVALSIWWESLPLLMIGRIWTGFSAGNASLAQAAVADITATHKRAKGLSYLSGAGSVGYVAGPWIGGLLANPAWLHGSVPFIFCGVVALINWVVMWLSFRETRQRSSYSPFRLIASLKRLGDVLRDPQLRILYLVDFIFLMGWSFWLIFSATYFVQRLHLDSNVIGDLYAYRSALFFVTAFWLNKKLIKKWPLKRLVIWGSILHGLGILAIAIPSVAWPYLLIFPFLTFGGGLAYLNLTAMISLEAESHGQGQVLGVSTAVLSATKVLSSLIAGVLAGVGMFLPLATAAALSFLAAVLLPLLYRSSLPRSAPTS